jgi:hypothetical protein
MPTATAGFSFADLLPTYRANITGRDLRPTGLPLTVHLGPRATRRLLVAVPTP